MAQQSESIAIPRAEATWTPVVTAEKVEPVSVTLATSMPSFDEIRHLLSELPIRTPYRGNGQQ